MKLSNKQKRWWEICQIAWKYYGLDTEKNFFTLNDYEMDRLLSLSRVINYRNSEPEMGRCNLRQLWYDLRKWNTSLDTPF